MIMNWLLDWMNQMPLHGNESNFESDLDRLMINVRQQLVCLLTVLREYEEETKDIKEKVFCYLEL